MAEIDDTISNQPISDDAFVEQEISTPNEEIESSEGVEVTMDEEGGAQIDFDPKAEGLESQDHFSNLAEIMEDKYLGELGSTLFDQYTEYKESRADWENTYEQRAFMNKDGITTELNKLYKITPGQRKSVFNIQHIEGFNKNPFKVHMTFGNQNLNEAYSRTSFTTDFGKANTYSEKKTAINKYYKSLGPDIVAQIGKQPKEKHLY